MMFIRMVGGSRTEISELIKALESDKKRKELGIPQNAFLVVSVGELNKNKNHSVIIRAIAELGDSSLYYAIAGKGTYCTALAELAKELGVSEQVQLLGYRTDIHELYAAADLCAFPSIREGQGLAAIEAMASGLPLIVSDNRGTRDFLGSENAITCKYDDVHSFAAGIIQMRDNAEKRYEMADNNKKKSEEFDKLVTNQIMEDLYS